MSRIKSTFRKTYVYDSQEYQVKQFFESLEDELDQCDAYRILRNDFKHPLKTEDNNTTQQPQPQPQADQHRDVLHAYYKARVQCLQHILDRQNQHPSTSSTQSSSLDQSSSSSSLDQLTTQFSKVSLNHVDHVNHVFPSDVTTESDMVCYQNVDTCPSCLEDFICIESESALVCPECGLTQQFQAETPGSFAEAQERFQPTPFFYKQSNHFRDILWSFMGMNVVDDSVIKTVKLELYKQKIRFVEDITYAAVRKILRQKKLSQHYENIFFIIGQITGDVIDISTELQEELMQNFDRVQAAFTQIVERLNQTEQNVRKNLPKYYYLLHKLLVISGRRDLAERLSLLRIEGNLRDADRYWKMVCDVCGFEFEASI